LGDIYTFYVLYVGLYLFYAALFLFMVFYSLGELGTQAVDLSLGYLLLYVQLLL